MTCRYPWFDVMAEVRWCPSATTTTITTTTTSISETLYLISTDKTVLFRVRHTGPRDINHS